MIYDVFLPRSIVIQTTEGRKDLECIHFWLRCVPEILRFALDDKWNRDTAPPHIYFNV